MQEKGRGRRSWINIGNYEHSFHLAQKKEILHQVGLIRDEIWNSTIVYGIQAKKKNGEPHKGLEGFHLEKEPVRISLLTVSELDQVWCYTNRIYVVENPSGFASIHLPLINSSVA